ncbi:LysM-like peptidoglycan-binding domain-containing protein [Yersinia similis]|uniref:Opacity-associated protein A n=1 Tax=Yersinia similis TaxID=367190 RepID=A0A0T9P883_9GAMM|nr:OapA family protein [Yersinia similis]CNF88690.1 opacity-associated protein A [Yersinia similis]CNH48944.1 opacity-associated protein A [Yersinia similis]
MGRIAPRRRKNNRVYQPLLHSWLTIRQKVFLDAKNTDEQNLISEISAPEQRVDPNNVTEPALTSTQRKGVQSIKGLWLKIWHLPDSFQWMEPLPFFHRRWVIIATAVLLLALLWPASRDNTNLSFPVSVPATSVPLQAQLQDNNDAPVPPKVSTPETTQGNWQSYQVQTGKTLAQLFRDNNLPVNDVFAMAQVEGSDKPLSNLKAGQEVKIMLDAQGVVTALAIETSESTEVLFSRQNDGSYRREH